jgi:ankyrin repeat protein
MGANVNQAGDDGWTPLQIAAQHNNMRATRILIEELDANILQQCTANGDNALQTARAYHSEDVVKYLMHEMTMVEERFV